MIETLDSQIKTAMGIVIIIAVFCIWKIGLSPVKQDTQFTQKHRLYKKVDLTRAKNNAAILAIEPSKININTATAEQLEKLPGIGPSLAKRIIEYRNLHGNFNSCNELMKVKGIGKKKLARIRQIITTK